MPDGHAADADRFAALAPLQARPALAPLQARPVAIAARAGAGPCGGTDRRPPATGHPRGPA